MQQLQYSNWKDLAAKYDYFMFDCDGVLWIGTQSIPGSFDALQLLKDLGKNFYFITNASQRTRDEVVQKAVKEHGFAQIDKPNIYTAAYITALYVKENVIKDPVQDKILLVGELGFKNELENSGI